MRVVNPLWGWPAVPKGTDIVTSLVLSHNTWGYGKKRTVLLSLIVRYGE